MTDTLSTHSSATTDKLVPTDTDKDPIKWDNNRATIEGKLHEVALYYTRTDQFIDLVENRATPLPSGKLALDSDQAGQFVMTYTSGYSQLTGYADASWETRNSTSGWVVLWQSAAVAGLEAQLWR